MTPDTQPVPVRDAATIILVRDPHGDPHVLMGQRGDKAVFMPSKFVFPGGAVDPGDADVPIAGPLNPVCGARLGRLTRGAVPASAFAAAAIRELWEETGLRLGRTGTWTGDVPADWTEFADGDLVPDASGLAYMFRAITPPGRPRRFDARFFAADAERVLGDPDDFSRASEELSHLQWVPVRAATEFNLPFITEVVLAELARALPILDPPPSVPFFDNSGPDGRVLRIGDD